MRSSSAARAAREPSSRLATYDGAGPVAPIGEANEYDNLYVVRLAEGGEAEVTTLKFGRRPQ